MARIAILKKTPWSICFQRLRRSIHDSSILEGESEVQGSCGRFLPEYAYPLYQWSDSRECNQNLLQEQGGFSPNYTKMFDRQSSRTHALASVLHNEVQAFCSQVTEDNETRKPYRYAAIGKVNGALQGLWPTCRTKTFGSVATGLALPSSDMDLVIQIPSEAKRNGGHLQSAARYLAKQDWVIASSVEIIENSRVPVIMLAGNLTEANGSLIRLDISFQSPSHTGILTVQLIKGLIERFPEFKPIVLVLKQFLMDRGLGSLSSYCLVLLVTRFFQQQYHLGRYCQDLGCLLMDFLHFFGCEFDPLRTCISVRGAGMYMNREILDGIDILMVEDPLHPFENAGRSCTSFLQCTQAFAEGYHILLNDLDSTDRRTSKWSFLERILPSLARGSYLFPIIQAG